MLIAVQITFASLLIAAAFALVLLWLPYGGQSGLMPWTGAGVLVFG